MHRFTFSIDLDEDEARLLCGALRTHADGVLREWQSMDESPATERDALVYTVCILDRLRWTVEEQARLQRESLSLRPREPNVAEAELDPPP